MGVLVDDGDRVGQRGVGGGVDIEGGLGRAIYLEFAWYYETTNTGRWVFSSPTLATSIGMAVLSFVVRWPGTVIGQNECLYTKIEMTTYLAERCSSSTFTSLALYRLSCGQEPAFQNLGKNMGVSLFHF